MTRAAAMRWLAGLGVLLVATLANVQAGVVSAPARTVTTQLTTFAAVRPIAVVRLRAPHAGVVTGLEVRPGDTLQSGALLGHLNGPQINAFLAQRKAALASARAALDAAQKALHIERQKLARHLSTQQAVARAEAAVEQAQSRVDSARARWQAAQALTRLRAPVSGEVLRVKVAGGERVTKGQTLLTLQPAGSLWLEAVYYGAAAASIHPGISGVFTPADGGPSIPVKVRSVIGATQPGGGRVVGLVAATPEPGWYNGEAGTVTLTGAQRTLPAVPTRALILDEGQWWVLVQSAQGVRRQAVTPGPSRGTWTLIEQGLDVGAEVVVNNAYLEFHRDFSQHYQVSD